MNGKIAHTEGLDKARNKLIELEKKYAAFQWISHHIQHSLLANIKKYPIITSSLFASVVISLCFIWSYQDVLTYLKNFTLMIMILCFYGYLAAIALGHIFFRLVFAFFVMLGLAWFIAR